MWMVVYVSHAEETVNKLVGVLRGNGIISRVRHVKNDDGVCFEVLVPQTELDGAQDLIFENELF